MQPIASTIASTRHTLILLSILAVLSLATFTANSSRSASHPNRIALYVSVIAGELLLARYVAIGARIPLRKLIGRFRWFDPIAAAAFWIIARYALLALRNAMGAFDSRSDAFLPHGAAEIVGWVCVSMTAGFVEELTYRGYLQRQFAAWTHSVAAGIALQAIAFGASHGYQGIKSIIVVAAYGALSGVLCQLRRGLAPAMLAHAWTDVYSGIFAA